MQRGRNHSKAGNSKVDQDRGLLLTHSQLPTIVKVAAGAGELPGSKDEAVGSL